MKKSIVKILTAALAAATVASMSVVPVFAHTKVDEWKGTDYQPATEQTAEQRGTAYKTISTITVTDLRETDNLKVTAYQIVKGVYKNGRLAGYELCSLGKDPDDTTKDLKIADIEKPTAAEITKIAKNINNAESGCDLTYIYLQEDKETAGTYTADVEAGLYIVLAKGADAVVYNPAIVAVNVLNSHLIVEDDKPFVEGGEVSFGADSYFNVDGNAYLKSSDSGFDKKVVGSHKPDTVDVINSKTDKGDTVAFGDTIDFALDEMTIPSYSDQYTDLVYKVEDTLDAEAFLGIKNFTVLVNDVETDPTTKIENDQDPQAGPEVVTNYTLKLYDAEGTELDPAKDDSFDNAVAYSVAFDEAFIRAHDSESVKITYSTVFCNTAGVNYAENKNRATLTYSNDPDDSENAKTKDKTTYHYTFGICASIDGQNEESGDDGDKETYEFNKVFKKDGEFEDAENEDGVPTKKNEFALPGATFTLYSDEACTEESKIAQAVSDTNGHIQFLGLDEGTYYLKETHAPRGYVLNEMLYKFIIEAEMDDAGVLTSYNISTYYKSEDGYKAAGSATYTNKYQVEEDTGNVINVINHEVDPVNIVDPKIQALPSTGGIGTIVITVIAAIGMAGFLTLFLYNRKKRKEEADKK